jgi:hypothetical protein
MSLSSSDLGTQLSTAGITFIPADVKFYTDFLYKIEICPKFKGLGGTSGDRYCTIKLGSPIKARADLARFNDNMGMLISNIEFRQEICEFIDSLPNVEYKSRMGGEYNLFYFRDAESVMILVNRYKHMISSVTGPINSEHTAVIEKNTIVLRNKLYHNRFRYYIEFARTQDFADNTSILTEYLDNLPHGTWRGHCLTELIAYYNNPLMRGQYNGRGARHFWILPKTVAIYLERSDDYIYTKLLTGEHVVSNHEVKLFTELDK